jgi:hypothetical protein
VRGPITWSVDRAHRTERSWVAGEARRLRWIALGELLLFALTVAALVALQALDPGPLAVACSILVGIQVGRAGIVSMRRAMAYRSGWLDGRSAFVHAMAEAQRRGMAPGDWLSAELARDYAVLGVEADGERLDPRDEL